MHKDLYEDLGWELPPTHDRDVQLEHYYHYPGVTLGVHHAEINKIKYERVILSTSGGRTIKSTRVFNVEIPVKLTRDEAVHVKIGTEDLVVTCPEKDTAGRFVYVTVLFYNKEAVKANCDCGCHLSGALNTLRPRKGSPGRRVHFAPLAAVRYPVAPAVAPVI